MTKRQGRRSGPARRFCASRAHHDQRGGEQRDDRVEGARRFNLRPGDQELSQRESEESLPRRSFDLRAQRLYDQLDPVEKEVAQALKTMMQKP